MDLYLLRIKSRRYLNHPELKFAEINDTIINKIKCQRFSIEENNDTAIIASKINPTDPEIEYIITLLHNKLSSYIGLNATKSLKQSCNNGTEYNITLTTNNNYTCNFLRIICLALKSLDQELKHWIKTALLREEKYFLKTPLPVTTNDTSISAVPENTTGAQSFFGNTKARESNSTTSANNTENHTCKTSAR